MPFEDLQSYYTALIFDDRGYRRVDFCDECWSGVEESLEPYSTWQGLYRMPPPKPEEPLKKETAETLLRRLMEVDDPGSHKVIYILGVMLERKKVLEERDVQTRDDGTLVRIYEHRSTGETFLIPDPRLRLDQLDAVQEQVNEMLGIPPRKAKS